MKLLTDEEINSLPSYPWGQRQDYARAVEEAVLAKLQEQEPVAWLDGNGSYYTYDNFDNSTPTYAAPVPAIPAGYRLVPVEPTEEMLQYMHGIVTKTEDTRRSSYKIMLDSAPQVVEQDDRKGAERYRWLKKHPEYVPADEFIDAEMAREEKNE